jgi:predicted negative regulator of RcsB-dependent stress response
MWTTILAFLGKGWERFVSIFAYILILAFIVYAGWRVFNPKPTTTQTGGVSYHYEIKVGFGGCARLPVVK